MKKFQYKAGFPVGKIQKYLPGIGLTMLDENVSDEVAMLAISSGISDIFEPKSAANQNPINGSESTISTEEPQRTEGTGAKASSSGAK